MIKLVCDLRQFDGFLRVLRFPPPIKLTVTEILLNVALNTITLTQCSNSDIRNKIVSIVLLILNRVFGQIMLQNTSKI